MWSLYFSFGEPEGIRKKRKTSQRAPPWVAVELVLCRPQIEETVGPFPFTSQGGKEEGFREPATGFLTYPPLALDGGRFAINRCFVSFWICWLLFRRGGRDLLGMIAVINTHLMTVYSCKKAGSFSAS